jgi:hypothetical protein
MKRILVMLFLALSMLAVSLPSHADGGGGGSNCNGGTACKPTLIDGKLYDTVCYCGTQGGAQKPPSAR